MSILIDENTTFIVQGITGREAVNLTRECLDYGNGAQVVGGVTPGRLGREVHGVPVFDTVQQAVERLEHGVLRERRRHGHHRAVDRAAVVLDALRDGVEHRDAVDVAPAAARRDAADDPRAAAVVEALAGEVHGLAPGDALDDERRVRVDEDAHAEAPATARRAASSSDTPRSAYGTP